MLLKARLYAITAFLALCVLFLIARTVTSKAGQMTSTLLIGGSKIDVRIESLRITAAILFRMCKSALFLWTGQA